MMCLYTLIWILSLIVAFEIVTYVIVHWTRKRFQWMITAKDEHPVITEQALNKFFDHGFDPELGWVRKPNTAKNEYGKFGKTTYHINSKGARNNPGFEKKKTIISCYGDSFTFARQVNDNETWEHYLSKLTKSNVQNFGVGNHGMAHALLRMQREYPKNKSKVVIMGVVPSTICRVLCVWKHYNEFGNIFGFGPRFVKKKGKFVLVKNIINEKKKFFELEKCLYHLREHDYFYKTKFRKEMIRFPYLFHFWKDPWRNVGMVTMTMYESFLKMLGKDTKAFRDKIMGIIMIINKKLRIDLFKNDDIGPETMEFIVDEFIKYGKKKRFKPVFLFMPQKDDVIYTMKHGSYYELFLDRIRKKLRVIDMTPYLQNRKDLDKLYSDDSVYGGHYSKYGNKFVADTVYKEIGILE